MLEMADRPRVLSVEYVVGDGYDFTRAHVMTPLGEQHIKVQRFWADKKSYPRLIEAAIGLAWAKFCNVN